MRALRPSLFACLWFALSLPGQVAPGHALVASRGAGDAATRLVEVDMSAGTVRELGGFPSDRLAPLGVAIDPINLDIVLALLRGGASRFVRLTLSGRDIVAESLLAEVEGTVSHVTIGARGDVFAAFGGPEGKLVRLPRRGGAPTDEREMPHAAAMTDFGLSNGYAVLVQSEPGADPQVRWVELDTGQTVQGPDSVPGLPPSPVTGVFDYPTGVARQLLSRADGTIALHLSGSGLAAQVLQIVPPLPPGGAVAMRGTLDLRPIVLGGSAHPYLKTFDLFAPELQWQVLSGRLPGDPVDYAVAPGPGVVQNFGVACGEPAPLMWGYAGGDPRLGNAQFRLQMLHGAPSRPALLVLGFCDLPPLWLPGGCDLLVSPGLVLLHSSDPFGAAEQRLPIPDHPSLLGLLFFAQWLQAPGLRFSTSEAASIRIGR